ncbi:DUF427 domain-containing protein [Persicobacter diffluens]|uniref:DUF427 domain-containing protein n=1 Tax=Persicobacter diffluens TaxID=981 RepID=A0AAN4VXA0_9BACT|nr:hypothetical protein PEDI_14860 [Persicobacter diffluens]
MKAIWKNQIIAESNETKLVEGNHYFPAESVVQQFLKPSGTHTSCPWKGQASYYHVEIEGEVNTDAAWYYEHPKPAAEEIRDHVAFYKGVKVVE